MHKIPDEPFFGGNPGNFHRPAPTTLNGTLVRFTRSLLRGAFCESMHAVVGDICNMGNQWLRGGAHPRLACSCCGQSAYAFVHLSNRLRIAWNSACPACDSRSRHRGLALLIPKLLGEGVVRQRVLHFAPELVLRKVLLQLPNVEYRTTDLFVRNVDYPNENIEALSFPDASFDVVLCNHVLEHVADDRAAMVQLARILTPDGVAVVTIPGDWNRQSTITFGNTDLNGHYRDYGMDVKVCFARFFNEVEVIDMHELDQAPNGLSYGIRPNDLAFVCRKPRRLFGQPLP